MLTAAPALLVGAVQCVNTKEEDERKKMTLGEGIEVPAVSAEILGLLHSLLGAISAAYDASGALVKNTHTQKSTNFT